MLKPPQQRSKILVFVSGRDSPAFEFVSNHGADVNIRVTSQLAVNELKKLIENS